MRFKKKGMIGDERILALILVLITVVLVAILFIKFDLARKLNLLPDYPSEEGSEDVALPDLEMISQFDCEVLAFLGEKDSTGYRKIYKFLPGNEDTSYSSVPMDLRFKERDEGIHQILSLGSTRVIGILENNVVVFLNPFDSLTRFRDNFRHLNIPPKFSQLELIKGTKLTESPQGIVFCNRSGRVFEKPSLEFKELSFESKEGVNDEITLFFINEQEFKLGVWANRKHYFEVKEGVVIKNWGTSGDGKISPENIVSLRELSSSTLRELPTKLLEFYQGPESDKWNFPSLNWDSAVEEDFSFLLYGVEDISEFDSQENS